MLRMIAVSVCLSRGLTRFHFAKTAERITMLFVANSLGDSRNIGLDSGPGPQRGVAALGENFDPQRISTMAGVYRGLGPLSKVCKSRSQYRGPELGRRPIFDF